MPLQLIAGSGWQLFAIVAFALALAFVFFLVIRQNRKDFEEIEAWLAEEKLKS
jgi:preprotein translocase subunit YajC